MHFGEFFQAAMGGSLRPYDYQCRLACGVAVRADNPKTLAGGCECRSQLINIPTGLGKTAAAVLAWLWNRSLPQLRTPNFELQSGLDALFIACRCGR